MLQGLMFRKTGRAGTHPARRVWTRTETQTSEAFTEASEVLMLAAPLPFPAVIPKGEAEGEASQRTGGAWLVSGPPHGRCPPSAMQATLYLFFRYNTAPAAELWLFSKLARELRTASA